MDQLSTILSPIITFLIAVWTFYMTRKNQRSIELFKTELQERKSENDARLDYEYEAKKRLYRDYEPLIFQMTEFAEDAYNRILRIAKANEQKYLGKGGWLINNKYFFESTIYRLFAPIALYRIIQKRLTIIDLQIEKNIFQHYILSKSLKRAFGDSFRLAASHPPLEYDPFKYKYDSEEYLINKDSKIYRHQGIAKNMIDNIADSLIAKDESGLLKIKSFGEFERFLNSDESEQINNEMNVLSEIFEDFTPDSRPITWRILFSLAMINYALMKIGFDRDLRLREIVQRFRSDELRNFKWSNDADIDKKLNDIYDACMRYFDQRILPNLQLVELDHKN